VFRNRFTSLAVTLRALLAFSWTLAFVVMANAGPLEDADAAVKNGDYATALRLFQMLAGQDNAVAQRRLGIMYLKGLGVPPNYAEAAKWIRAAADKGLAEAQNEAGILYQRGWGVERNDVEAVKWYRLAADQGLVISQNNLADTYAQGRGVPQNFGEAFKWYRVAADQGSSYAENIVGIAYEHGVHVAQDDTEAFRWYRRAANKIYDRPNDTWIHSPQYNFAAMYASGRGTAQDYVQALTWFTLAAAFGDTKAPDAFGIDLLGTSKLTALEQRDRLVGLMTSAQIGEAERLAREWRPHLIITIESQN
jgi:TPR repeat protein